MQIMAVMGPMDMEMVHQAVRVVVPQPNNNTGITISSITVIHSLFSNSGRGKFKF